MLKEIEACALYNRLTHQKYTDSLDYGRPYGDDSVSTEWLDTFLKALDPNALVSELTERFVQLAQIENIDKVRWELARIPVWFKLVEEKHQPDFPFAGSTLFVEREKKSF